MPRKFLTAKISSLKVSVSGGRRGSNAAHFLTIYRHCIQFGTFYVIVWWKTEDLVTLYWKNFFKIGFQALNMVILDFFIVFPKTRFRGFSSTLSWFSQDWVKLLTWNFQESFNLWLASGWMKQFFEKMIFWFLNSKRTNFRFQTPWNKILKKNFIHPEGFHNTDLLQKN